MSTHKLHQTYPVGMVCSVGRRCMNNREGALAVVYENYDFEGRMFGVSMIFQNGNYDGFSEEDMQIFEVNPVRLNPHLAKYKFQNVGQLSDHFRIGVFDKALMVKR